MKPFPRLPFALLAAALALAGCDAEQAAPSGPPAATVTATTVAEKPWSDTLEALGAHRGR